MRRETISRIVNSAMPFSDNKRDVDFFYFLAEALLRVPKVKNQPPILEVGTRRGGTALLMLKIVKRAFKDTVVVTVDPYGNKPYDHKPYQYGNRFYTDMKELLASYANHIHYHLTSQELIGILDKVTYWYKGRHRNFSRFSFIYLDGSHLPGVVKMEFHDLFPRLIPGGQMLVDNTDFHHQRMRKYFERLGSSNKKIRVISTTGQTLIEKLKN